MLIARCLRRSLCAALLGAACSQASAEVYRCEQGGVIRYSDRPCGPKAAPVKLPPAMIVPAGPSADLLGDADRLRKENAEARDKADAEWVEQYQARKADEDRLRQGRVTGTVVQGMSPQDVRRIHGEPKVVSRSKGKSERETWSYVLDDGTRMHVTFAEGRVASLRTRKQGD